MMNQDYPPSSARSSRNRNRGTQNSQGDSAIAPAGFFVDRPTRTPQRPRSKRPGVEYVRHDENSPLLRGSNGDFGAFNPTTTATSSSSPQSRRPPLYQQRSPVSPPPLTGPIRPDPLWLVRTEPAVGCPFDSHPQQRPSAADEFRSRRERSPLYYPEQDEWNRQRSLQERIHRQRMEELKRNQFEAASVSDDSIPLRQKRGVPDLSPTTVTEYYLPQSLQQESANSETYDAATPVDSSWNQDVLASIEEVKQIDQPRGYTTTGYEERHTHQEHVLGNRHRQLSGSSLCNTNTRTKASNNLMEISPGVYARLRGVAEIKSSVRRDDIVPVLCYACELAMFCIVDASFVLCPKCRVVNPNEDCSSSVVAQQEEEQTQDIEHNGMQIIPGGVSLGFTFADLQNFQMEILQESGSCSYY